MDNSPVETNVYQLEGAWNFYARFGNADGYDSFVDGGYTYETSSLAHFALARFLLYAAASGDVLGEAWQDDGQPSAEQRRATGQLELPLG